MNKHTIIELATPLYIYIYIYMSLIPVLILDESK